MFETARMFALPIWLPPDSLNRRLRIWAANGQVMQPTRHGSSRLCALCQRTKQYFCIIAVAGAVSAAFAPRFAGPKCRSARGRKVQVWAQRQGRSCRRRSCCREPHGCCASSSMRAAQGPILRPKLWAPGVDYARLLSQAELLLRLILNRRASRVVKQAAKERVVIECCE